MIQRLILEIHHVYRIDQVRVVLLFYSLLTIFTKDNGTAWQYKGTNGSIKSSLKILGNSLKSNQTYQFMVCMENHQNSSLQAIGYLLVQVEDTQPQLVVVA